VENEQLVSEKWVNAAHQSSSSNENYGYMWWINKVKPGKAFHLMFTLRLVLEETIS
jgi:hypothetical protein